MNRRSVSATPSASAALSCRSRKPRRPCWKIDARYSLGGITAFINESGHTGWYYRVLEEGEVAGGDEIALIERPAGAVPLATPVDDLAFPSPRCRSPACDRPRPGLTPAWVKRIDDRLAWLAANPAASEDA